MQYKILLSGFIPFLLVSGIAASIQPMRQDRGSFESLPKQERLNRHAVILGSWTGLQWVQLYNLPASHPFSRGTVKGSRNGYSIMDHERSEEGCFWSSDYYAIFSSIYHKRLSRHHRWSEKGCSPSFWILCLSRQRQRAGCKNETGLWEKISEAAWRTGETKRVISCCNKEIWIGQKGHRWII